MKIRIILISIFMMFGLVSIQAQDDIFEKLSDHEDVSTVLISKALLKMMGGMMGGDMIPDMSMGGMMPGVNIKDIAGKLEQIEIYSSETTKGIKLMKSEAGKLQKNKSYEVLMKIKDKDENVTFYGGRKDKSRFKDLIMFVDNEGECSIIRISGSFTAEDVQGVIDGKSD
ncbi:MAG: DUF4252 domain-containing protein [Prevotella sp.]|jgi:hypothetical protein|nr:DUF4252 domain-containing protein [Prevotella sp.]